MRRYTVKVDGRDVVVDVDEMDADRFEVAIGEKKFHVEVAQDVGLDEAHISPAITEPGTVPLPPAAAQGPVAAAAPRSEKAAPIAARPGPPGPPAASSTSLVTAPLPGVIVSIDVAEGAQVTRGTTLVTLEAMKMKNAIRSPRDGVVVAIFVENGAQVAHGQALVDVKEKRP